jgi:hypothetical protein
MAIREIAQGLVSLCQSGQLDEAMTRYYAQDIVSVEASGNPAEMRGLAAVQEKSKWFVENHEVHGLEVEGPYINGDQFVVRFKVDLTPKATGQRANLDEVGVYTVKGDKIVHERFFPQGA